MTHISVDIGASSGRLVIGDLKEDKLQIKEIHRFANGFLNKAGTLYWDVDHLLHEILAGLQIAKKSGHEQCTLGIDTWAVDYVLLNEEGKRIKEVVSYRDQRTKHTIDKVTKTMTKRNIYHKTGIQFLPFNTFYQLYEEEEDILSETKQILLVPDYLNYCLTGKAFMEVTNGSSTQLLNVSEREFDEDLLQKIGIGRDQFPQLVEPGHTLGMINNEWFPKFDLPECLVINVASHDTASAVVATPSNIDHWAYLSSGTWSLLGIETKQPIINSHALDKNYTNEWGAYHTYRFLKNIMGMWIIQEVRRNLSVDYNFGQLVELAQEVKPFQQYINFNDDRFLHPSNMIEEIKSYCRETNQAIPTTPGELAACVYNNLAIIYATALEELENITDKEIQRLYIVGGGGQNELLNQLTANISNKEVHVGPTEATAIGNILIQLITVGKLANLEEGRQLLIDSFEITTYDPQDFDRNHVMQRFKEITAR